jgi:hypothetical protein
MKPTIELFNGFDRHGKAVLIYDYGEFLLSREYYAKKFNLYAMPGYYAEIIYNPVDNTIEEIRALVSSSHEVNKYLPYINLEELG